MLEHILGLPDLMLFWTDDVSVIRVSRCGIIRGTLSGQHVLTFIWMIMTGGSFKIVSNWAVLTVFFPRCLVSLGNRDQSGSSHGRSRNISALYNKASSFSSSLIFYDPEEAGGRKEQRKGSIPVSES